MVHTVVTVLTVLTVLPFLPLRTDFERTGFFHVHTTFSEPFTKQAPEGQSKKTVFLHGFCAVFHKRCPTAELTARGAQRGLYVKLTKFGPGRAFRGNFEAARRGQTIVNATAPTPPRPYLVAA